MGFKEKLMDAITVKVIGYLVLLPALVLWVGWMYGGQVIHRAWTLPAETQVALAEHVTSETERIEKVEEQYEQVQKDLAYLKMLWGRAKIQTTGRDEVYAVINSRSPAVRFRPGTEVWITNNTDEGERRIRCEIRETTFRDDPSILIRLSAKAGEELEASEVEISVGLAVANDIP